MSVTGATPKKKTSLLSPQLQQVATTISHPSAKQAKRPTTIRSSGGFCRGFSDCLVMGSTASRHSPPPIAQFEKQNSFDYSNVEALPMRKDLSKNWSMPQFAASTRYSLVKGERIVRSVLTAWLLGLKRFGFRNIFGLRLAEIEMELQKQREVRTLYKMKLESTQAYLRHCLQRAQDNGFLDLIIGKKDKQQESLLSPDRIISDGNINPQIPHPVLDHSYLLALIEQAKMHGWYIEPNEIKLQEKVAQGTTANVYRGRWRGCDVAVKCIFPDLFQSNENMVGFFAQEVETLARQRHPFVLQLMGACLGPPSHGWIVTEFLSTNLKIWMHGPGSRRKERTVPLPPLKERLEKALEISQAMQYLHEHKPMIIHRDLKPSNIFLDDDMHVKVADFGHARFLTNEEKALTGETGTYVYMAPEVIRCAPYDEKSDVYSFGVILNELITGEHPYMETDYGPSKIALEVANNGLRPALPKHQNELEQLIELIKHSWDDDATIRPPFATITCCLEDFLTKLPDTHHLSSR